jgi:hypothetical protein
LNWPPTPHRWLGSAEICNRYETNVVNSARDSRLADDVGADNVVMHLTPIT